LTTFASKDSLCFETGWETLENRRKNRKLTIFYKIHSKICPPYLFNCLPPVTSYVNNYNLRNNENYVPPWCRLRTSASSFISKRFSPLHYICKHCRRYCWPIRHKNSIKLAERERHLKVSASVFQVKQFFLHKKTNRHS
jgi:hypothetical protein